MVNKKINRSICFCERNLLKNKKRFCKKNNLSADVHITKKKNSVSGVNYISDTNLQKLDPFTGSITSFSALNPGFFNNIINVYYANETNEKITNVVDFFSGQKDLNLSSWNENNKNNHSLALEQAFNLIGMQIVEVNDFESANLVVGNIQEYLNVVGFSTSPYELDLYSFLENKLFLFYSGMFEDDETSPGSYWFHVFLHYTGHLLGLTHPHGTSGGTKSMPGSCFEDNETSKNTGLFSMNSILTTQMSDISTNVPFVSNSTSIDWQSTSYPRTYMSLDIKALRFLYNISSISSKNLSWQDNSCPPGVCQLLLSGPEGINLKLNPDQDNYSPIYNLTLDQFTSNPGFDSKTILSSISRPGVSSFGASILDEKSFISRVQNNYEELNVYSSYLLNDTEIVLSGANCKNVNLYLGGNNSDYDIIDEVDKVEITNKSNGKKLKVDFNNYDAEIKLVLFGRNTLVSYESVNASEISSPVKEEPVPEPQPPAQPNISLENPENIGSYIIGNLTEDHYNEIVDSFFEINPKEDLAGISMEHLTSIINDYAVSYIAERFKSKLVGKPLPLMAETVKKKR